ncbi:MarR family winged helix-turn-helix transcriptional regulator [Streptomyces fuscigenes]|jgi:DNA-binding MarR family transcriptional regulator|uniref:MarR family winged helix-turn-helix transcriptional regulator n=1 Tax=Streptomyces fuscigenes TaxID=1528880 RepID=UPI001F485FE2|nr:MarR family transcriptional regulator [Streptomyces fuscigenes]MCF3963496.1 MarR family transcriptional regulator [Streptomyces fuscigenes]
MPPIQDMTSDASVSQDSTGAPDREDRREPASTASEFPDGAGLLDALQHQVAIFARRAEQTRLGGVGQVRNTMDRAAYLLLNRLDLEGPMGVKALAAGMGIDSSTVTRQVAPLVDSGLVKRTSHPEDGRAVVLELSERGRARLDEVRVSRRRLMQRVTEDWTEEEKVSFTTLLTRFNRNLPAAKQSPPQEDAPPAS